MAKHSISEAARLVGKARSTIQRDLKNQVLSREKDGKGNPVIDTAELERVYGKLKQTDMSEGVSKLQSVAPLKNNEINELKIEVERLREKINSRDEKNELLSDQIDDLKAQRDKWEKQAVANTALLTHDRQMKSDTGTGKTGGIGQAGMSEGVSKLQSVAPQEDTQIDPTEQPPGFFKKLFGAG